MMPKRSHDVYMGLSENWDPANRNFNGEKL